MNQDKHVPRSRDNAKSPYNKRPFKKNKNKRKPAPVKRGEPTFIYLCTCHNERAEKKPCERSAEDRQDGKPSESPLGTWHCPVTKLKCKVRRVKNTGLTPTADTLTAPTIRGEDKENDADVQ